MSLPLILSLATLALVAVTLIVVGLPLAARLRKQERSGDIASDDSVSEMREIGQRIEALVNQQQEQGETQRQRIAQQMDSVEQSVGEQRVLVDGLRSEMRHEFQRRDHEMEAIRNQIASIQHALPDPSALALPPAETFADDAMDAPSSLSPTMSSDETEAATVEAEPMPEASSSEGIAEDIVSEDEPSFFSDPFGEIDFASTDDPEDAAEDAAELQPEIEAQPDAEIQPEAQSDADWTNPDWDEISMPASETALEAEVSDATDAGTPVFDAEEAAPEVEMYTFDDIAEMVDAITAETEGASATDAPLAETAQDETPQADAHAEETADSFFQEMTVAETSFEDTPPEEVSALEEMPVQASSLPELPLAEMTFDEVTFEAPDATVASMESQADAAPELLALDALETFSPSDIPEDALLEPAESDDMVFHDPFQDPFAVTEDTASASPPDAPVPFEETFAPSPETADLTASEDDIFASDNVFASWVSPSLSTAEMPTDETFGGEESPADDLMAPVDLSAFEDWGLDPEPPAPSTPAPSFGVRPAASDDSVFDAWAPSATEAPATDDPAPDAPAPDAPAATAWVARNERMGLPTAASSRSEEITPAPFSQPITVTPTVDLPAEPTLEQPIDEPAAAAVAEPTAPAPDDSPAFVPERTPAFDHEAPILEAGQPAPTPTAQETEPALADGLQEGDDLSLLPSVDEDTERALRLAGVTTFDEIARWGRTDARRIASQVGVSEEMVLNHWVFEAQTALFERFTQQAGL